MDKPATEVYPDDANCAAGDQWCADAVIHRPIGGISQNTINWQNRPTYQQVVEFPRTPLIRHRNRGTRPVPQPAERGGQLPDRSPLKRMS